MVERLLLPRFVLWGKGEIVERLICDEIWLRQSSIYFFLKIYKMYMHKYLLYYILFYFFNDLYTFAIRINEWFNYWIGVIIENEIDTVILYMILYFKEFMNNLE